MSDKQYKTVKQLIDVLSEFPNGSAVMYGIVTGGEKPAFLNEIPGYWAEAYRDNDTDEAPVILYFEVAPEDTGGAPSN